MSAQKNHDCSAAYEALSRAFGAPVWQSDLTGQVVEANDAWRRLVGDAGETHGADWLQALVHPDDVASVPDGSSGIGGVRLRIRAGDGGFEWHSLRVVPIRDGFGQTTGMAGELRPTSDPGLGQLGAVIDAVQGLDEHLAIYDSAWRYLFINEGGARTLGMAREELIGRCIWEIFPSAVGNQYYRELHEVAATGRPIRSVHHFQAWDRWYENYVYPHPNGVAVLSRDVTEAKLNERSRKFAEARFQALVEQAPISVQTFAPDGTPIHANPAWERLFDSRLEELQGYNILRDPQMEARGVLPLVHDAFAGEAREIPVAYYDPALIGKVGRPRWVEAQLYPVRSHEGEVQEVALLLEDVTDHVEAAESVRRSQRRYESLVRATSQIVWTTDARGSVVEDLSTWREVTGQSEAEIMGDGWLDRLHPEDAESMRSAWRRAVADAQPMERESRVLTAAGDYRLMRIYAVPVRDEDGSVAEWVGTCTDITERRENEEQLARLTQDLERRVEERTAELQRANRDLESFTYMVAHDLRAPLRSVISTSRILLDEHALALSSEAVELLGRQAFSAKRLATLIDDLLVYSRVGRRVVDPTPLDLSSLGREIVAEIREGSPCEFEVQDEMRATGDPDLMRLVLRNLLGNAAKYSPGGGVVRFGQSAVGEFFVADQGIGFDMQYEAKLWQPFARLVLDDQFPGTGIGLANVRQIVERHGGTVRAEGELGVGATFYFTLPAP